MLPINNGKIDFDFMESFIAKLEAERVAELSLYLTACGFNNCELSVDETASVNKLPFVQWKEYRMGDLFDKIKTQKLPYQAKNSGYANGSIRFAVSDFEFPKSRFKLLCA